jgi:hypothetical protein
MNRARACWAASLLVTIGAFGRAALGAEADTRSAWSHVLEIPLRPTTARWLDLVLQPADFGPARPDLGDLRLIDPAGREVPYDLRVRRTESRGEPLAAREFNRSAGADGSSQLALDLGAADIEHNEVEVELPGIGVRRRVSIDGSTDGKEWHELATKDLIHFRVDGREVEDRRVSYAPSRFRYVRLRVRRDRELDLKPVVIGTVLVRRRVEVRGEYLTFPIALGKREPVKTDLGPGSAWIFSLGGERVPCERILLEVVDQEFARNFRVEAGGLDGSSEPFRPVADGLWRRRAGELQGPIIAEFGEVTAARLKLIVIDQSNPPLEVTSATFTAAARELVLARPASLEGSLRLYSGNPKADPPGYDFARNLPARLDPPPERLAPGAIHDNPTYRPEPKPLTERWPWLIYVILGAICAVLGGIIVDLARAAIRLDDERRAVTVGTPPMLNR